ncbi:alcohol dehydrogenase catalytic domain-containing protein [Gracilibacillus sp. JCM 18860]|uniref:zinc-binding dehydrogenase n=1 Tax=Gracilibacillus sp. JCM 18860 TaxID=1306159 RepID=UPI0006D01CE8
MEYIVCEQPGKLRKMVKRPPEKAEGTAIIDIKRIGVCGTDIHAFKGNQPFFKYPRVLGHELAGTVSWIDDTSSAIKRGDQVAVIPYLECGNCIACRNGKTNCCIDMNVLGVHRDGGMCEQLSVPIDHLVLTNELTLDETAVIEPISIGAHAVRRSELRQGGETVLVIGAGPIGLGVMAIANQKGAKVIAMDIDEKRLKFCREWAQIKHTVNGSKAPIDKLLEITNGELPTVVFDATGNPTSMNTAFQYVSHGGKLVYVGLVKEDITFFDPDFHAKELTLFASRNATREDFQFVKEMILSKKVNVKDYITDKVPFESTVSNFQDWLQPQSDTIKTMIVRK